MALFDKLTPGGADAMRRYGIYQDCWSFQNKAHLLQLQAADIWAWENYRYTVDSFVPGKLLGLKPKKPRASYLALTDSPVQVRYHV